MINFVKKYWLEGVMFLVVSAIYVICTAPAPSWVSLDCDAWDFLYATKFLTISHFPGYPVYVMLGALIQLLPWSGVDVSAWAVNLFLSTIPGILSVILVFYITRRLTPNKWAPYVAALALAGASAYFSQAIITNTKVLTGFMMMLTWFLLLRGNYSWGAIVGGLTCGCHVFSSPAILAMLFFFEGFRKKWYLFVPCAVLPYGYVIFGALTTPWNASLPAGSGWEGTFNYAWGTVYNNFQYWGAIAIWNFPERLFETAMLLVTSFGLAVVPMFYYFKDWRKAGFMIACIVVPVFYYIGCNVETAYAHFIMAFPFLAVAAGIGLDKFKLHPAIILTISAILLVILPLSFDVGNTIDKRLSAWQMYNEVAKIPDGSVVVGYCENTQGKQSVGAREQVGIMYYNRINDKHIIPLNTDWLINPDKVGERSIAEWNRGMLEHLGLKVPVLVGVKSMDDKLTGDQWRAMTLENIRRLQVVNPDRIFYITKTINDVTGDHYIFARQLAKWESK